MQTYIPDMAEMATFANRYTAQYGKHFFNMQNKIY